MYRRGAYNGQVRVSWSVFREIEGKVEGPALEKGSGRMIISSTHIAYEKRNRGTMGSEVADPIRPP